MNEELQKRFEEHTPLMVYPFGIGDSTGPRVIAEGFVYPHGVVFFDIGWNTPYGGYHSNHVVHFVEGRVEGPFPDFEETVYWILGHATIHEIPDDGDGFSFSSEFAAAKENQRLVERFKEDDWNNRNRAKVVADRLARAYAGCR